MKGIQQFIFLRGGLECQPAMQGASVQCFIAWKTTLAEREGGIQTFGVFINFSLLWSRRVQIVSTGNSHSAPCTQTTRGFVAAFFAPLESHSGSRIADGIRATNALRAASASLAATAGPQVTDADPLTPGGDRAQYPSNNPRNDSRRPSGSMLLGAP